MTCGKLVARSIPRGVGVVTSQAVGYGDQMLRKRHRTPPEYEWIAVGPESQRLGVIVFGAAMIAGAFRTMTTADSCLRYQPWLSPRFHASWIVVIAGAAALWAGAIGATPGWFIAAGVGLIVVALLIITMSLITASTESLVLGKETFRLTNRAPRIGFDREYRWDDIHELSLIRDMTSRRRMTHQRLQTISGGSALPGSVLSRTPAGHYAVPERRSKTSALTPPPWSQRRDYTRPQAVV